MPWVPQPADRMLRCPLASPSTAPASSSHPPPSRLPHPQPLPAPAVQASLPANTYVVSGNAENKSFADILPTLLSQMGPSGLKMLTEQLAKGRFGDLGGAAGAGGDEEMPTLETGSFDEGGK
jgi:hypothetical protein